MAKAYNFHCRIGVPAATHLGLNIDPSMSRDIKELIAVAALFTGMDQLLPKDTIVKAFVKKLVNTLSGVKCLVMNVCPYRSSNQIMSPNPTSPTAANAAKPARRTAGGAHF